VAEKDINSYNLTAKYFHIEIEIEIALIQRDATPASTMSLLLLASILL
jgi:hypothetical protein